MPKQSAMNIKDYADVMECARILAEDTAAAEFVRAGCFSGVTVNPGYAVGNSCDGGESYAGKKSGKTNRDMVYDKVFYADNLHLLRNMTRMEEYRAKFNLIYIDPPFFTRQDHNAVSRVGAGNVKHLAYNDHRGSGKKDYLTGLAARLILMKDLLADDGLIWLHLDWHIVHYVKILMDEIFGEKNFINEVIWTYKSGGSGKRRFSRKHDNLLLYARSSKYKLNIPKEKSYNRMYKPYRFKGIEEYKDEQGWYTLVNMKDVWQIDMVGRSSKERTGYATQKPERLLKRIIEASTDEGDLCGDFFSGSGTLAAVSAECKRRFVICDRSATAVGGSVERLTKAGCDFLVFEDPSLRAETRLQDCESIGIEVIDSCGKNRPLKSRECERSGFCEVSLIESETGDPVTDGRTLSDKPDGFHALDTIKYWAVDTDYDGKIFRPEAVFLREKGKLCTSCTIKKEKLFRKRVLIKVIDIFGNIFYELL